MTALPWTDADAARAKEIREASASRSLSPAERDELRALRRREINESIRIRRGLFDMRRDLGRALTAEEWAEERR